MATTISVPEQRIRLHDVRWETYEHLLCDQERHRSPRLAYDKGELEIRRPLPEHEQRNCLLEQVVLCLADEQNREVIGLGSTTFRQASLQRGFEPDSCYYLQNAAAIPSDLRNVRADDLPAPDLVIEIDITHASMDKLPLYAAFGVGEVWRDNGERVAILLPTEDGAGYRESERSRAFPQLDAATLSEFVTLSRTLRRLDWLGRLRAWVRGAA